MKLRISRLGPGDPGRAAVNCAHFWEMSTETANLVRFLDDPHCILLAADIDGDEVGQVVGYILERWDAKKPMLFLYSVDVDETHRCMGIARRLIEEFLRIGRAAGCGTSFVFTNASNSAAMQLYRSTGGIRPHEDDVLFEWD